MNIRGFGTGVHWNGNRNGRPKKVFHRDSFTDELFFKQKERISSIVDNLFVHAENNEPWAMKLVLEYFLTKPKNDDSGEPDNKINPLVAKVVDVLNEDELLLVRNVLANAVEREQLKKEESVDKDLL